MIGSALSFFILFFVVRLFQVQKVEVYGGSPEENKTLALLFKSQSTFTLQQSDIAKIVRTRFPTMEVKESRIQLPNSVFLVVEKDKPVAFLQTDYGYVALSDTGTVVQKERSDTIPNPVIHFYQTIHHSEYQMGQKVGFSAIQRALVFISLLSNEGYQTETVAIDSVDMIACKTKGFEVAFSQTRPIELQVHEVRQIIRQIKVGALRIGRLDLRFDKPVVQLPQK